VITPWGDLPVADAHVHFFSHRFFALLAQQKQTDPDSVLQTLGWDPPAEDPVVFAAHWAAELDRHGVSKAMLIASLPPDYPSVAAAVARFPQRFWGAAMVNPLDPATIANLSPLVASGLIRMLCLFPAMHGYSIQDEAVKNLIQAIPRARIFVHCGILSVGVRGKLGLPSRFDLKYSNPIDLHALALEFPQTRFLIPHFGAGYWRETLMVAQLCPNVWLDTSSSNSWIRLQAPSVTLPTVFAETLAITGPHRLLFGSDSSFFPRGWNAQLAGTQFDVLNNTTDPSVARLILADNLNTFCEI
jgi:predicted TIM-barrel fold metal-dependent hydrolase